MAEPFAEKLEVVLKALAISRGRLAADLAVDKSVVSRWLSGRYVPSGENLVQLTRLIAARAPGFTGLDWDRDPAGLAALLAGHAPAPATTPRHSHGLDDRLPGLDAARARNALHANSWCGHWTGYRQTFRDTDTYVRDVLRFRPAGDDVIMDWRHDTVEGHGLLVAGDGKGYATLTHRFSDIPGIFIFYTMDGRPMQVIDGLVTTVTIAASREVIAAPYVMIRAADLADDPADDDRLLAARMLDDWTVASDALPPGVADRIAGRFSHGVLRVGAEGTLARFSTAAESAAAAAETARLLSFD